MNHLILLTAASAAITMTAVPAAVAADSPCPQVEGVRLAAAPAAFGGAVDAFVRNGPESITFFCLSGRCVTLHRDGAGDYLATGALFDTRLRRGERRRVRIVASRDDHTAVWGPRRVTVRR